MIRRRPAGPARLLVPLLLAVAGCAESSEPEAAPAGADSARVEETRTDPAAVGGGVAEEPPGPVERWAARLPEGALVRRGACPFECCVYREWEAESRIGLVSEPTEGAPSSGELVAGTAFQADSGFVRVTELSLVAVTDTVTPMPDRSLAPGDTLVLLDYVGEGFHTAWLDGEFVEVADFWSPATDRPRGEVMGEHASEWWVHATGPGGVSGWFRADAPGVEIGNADACG